MNKPPPLSRIAHYNVVVEDNELIRAYIAGVIDSRGGLRVQVGQDDSFSVGYTVKPMITIRRKDPELLELLAYWANEIGIESSLREKQGTYIWRVTRRDDVAEILERLEPFMFIYDGEARVMIEEILPRLESQSHTTKQGFVELMGYVDQVRESLETRGTTKYDQEYFRELWADEIQT